MSWAAIRAAYPDGVRDIIGGGPFDWPAGHATDDTDLTRAVLLAYLHPGDDVVRSAADRMLEWWRGDWPDRQPGPPRDIGGATHDGLRRYAQTADPRAAGAGRGRAGNGSLMRCIPTALAVPDPARRVVESMAISAVTHDDPRCLLACAAYNGVAAALVAAADPVAALEAGVAVLTAAPAGNRSAAGEVAEAIARGREMDLARAARTGVTGLPLGGTGFVLDSLHLAVAAVADPRPFPEVIIDIVRLGGDTDTNAAIAGGLVGARDGVAAIPPDWLVRLQFRDEFLTAADVLTRR
jgi:ADP-ribosylglycohydrolase